MIIPNIATKIGIFLKLFSSVNGRAICTFKLPIYLIIRTLNIFLNISVFLYLIICLHQKTFIHLRILLPIYLFGSMSKIFNISEAATIALHSMGLIARSEKLINSQEIAEITGFSKNHIAKVLQQLVKNGFLLSTRGPKGGFLMSEKARISNLMDVYQTIEGQITETTSCKMQCEFCPFSNCIFGGLEQKFSAEFRNYLLSKKVVEL